MKKILLFLFLVTIVSSCYEDYIKDFDYSAVYFTYQCDVRTFVVGEGMKINAGVALGGVSENLTDRNVGYQFDPTLITPAILSQMKGGATYIKDAVASVSELQLLPDNYFTISDPDKFIIKKGEHSGKILIRPDSTVFLSDAKTKNPNYVLPFLITDADADTIIANKNYSVIGVKFENMLFGNYWHGGATIVKDATGTIINTILYNTTIPSPEANVWILTTAAPFDLTIKGYSNIRSTKPELKLTLDGGNITISRATGSTYTYLPDGINTFNQAKLLQNRKIYLKYKYQNSAGNWCYATDTLTFRNRIRDGVNEWQDEDPAHYQ